MPTLSTGVVQQIMEEKCENSRAPIACEKPRNVNCPVVAVPEKIVLCIDISQDFTCKPYTLKDESSCSPFQILKKTLTSFVNNKHSINIKHEFAVMSLEPGSVKWIQDFSSDPKEIISAVNDLELVCLTEPQQVNITTVFKEVQKHVGNLPQVRMKSVQFPTHIVRLILLYNSSYNLLKIEDDENSAVLISSDYFHLDILYLHDAPSSENKCQDIFSSLLNVALPNSYVFESSRKVVNVYNNMAKLLAHPLQRSSQPFLD